MDENIGCIVPIIVGVILLLFVVCGVCLTGGIYNKINESKWNNGSCPKCQMTYELKTVDDGIKYYVCRECGQVVEVY